MRSGVGSPAGLQSVMGLTAPAKSCKTHMACFSKTASETSPELSLFTPRLFPTVSHIVTSLSLILADSCSFSQKRNYTVKKYITFHPNCISLSERAAVTLHVKVARSV